MNILYLTQFFSATRGGGPLIFYDLATALSEIGHKIYIICNVATEEAVAENVKLYTVKPYLSNTNELPPSPIQNLRYITNSVLCGAGIARKKKIDIIHTNSFTPVIAGSILSKMYRIPMVASIYDIFTNSDKSNWKKWVEYNDLPRYYSTIGRIYEKISLNMPFNLIHTISNTTKSDIMLHKNNRNIEVVYPGINDKLYQRSDTIYDDFVLYIGRLVFYKNLDILIKAFTEVIKELPNARLIVVGDGPMKEEWEELARSVGVSNNLLFTGHISHEEKLDLLRRCAVLALPSVFEGFGLVILEAFAMGKPVLVADIPPLDEIVNQDVDGFLLAHNDPNQWARTVINLLADKQLCRKMGSEAAKKIKVKFDFKSYIKRMESLYAGVIGNSGKYQEKRYLKEYR
jgi:glycosyltransferase involved in cell wall biosynthesis